MIKYLRAEFTGRLADLWAHYNETRLDFSRLVKLKPNAHIELLYGSLRDEYLNLRWFETLIKAEKEIEA